MIKDGHLWLYISHLLALSFCSSLTDPPSLRIDVVSPPLILPPSGDSFALALNHCRKDPAYLPSLATNCVAEILGPIRLARIEETNASVSYLYQGVEILSNYINDSGGAHPELEMVIESTRSKIEHLRALYDFELDGTLHNFYEPREHGVLARSIRTALWHQFHIIVHFPKECRFVSGHIISHGFYDPVKSVRINQLLTSNNSSTPPWFVDVGAHVGWFSMLAKASGANVVAVEPLEYNRKLLETSLNLPQNRALNGSLALVKTALGGGDWGEGTTHVCMKADDGNIGNARVVEEGECESVGVARLDDVLHEVERGMQVAVMKVDVEGMEGDVLRGASSLFGSEDRQPCVVIAEYLGGADKGMFVELKKYGYVMYNEKGEFVEFEEGDDIPGADYEFRSVAERCRWIPEY